MRAICLLLLVGGCGAAPARSMAVEVLVPPGTLSRGCTAAARECSPDLYVDEVEIAAPGTVDVDGFFIDRLEVSAYEYAACVQAGACVPSSDTISDDATPADVSFEGAAQYCRWKGKRLPTDVEWERAARGDGRATYPWGSDAPTCNHADLESCERVEGDVSERIDRRGAHPRGASPYGVEDLAGSAAEFVDRRRDDGRVLVKGASVSPDVNYRTIAVHYGEWVEADRQRAGFRCARDAGR